MYRQKNTPKLTAFKQFQDQQAHDQLWTEIKFSKNLPRRSYHTTVLYQSTLYVFGGYDINSGILGDFYSINLNQKNFKWEQIKNQGLKPNARHSHSAIVYNDTMWIYGGKIDTLNNSNELYSYDFKKALWKKQKENTGIIPPNLDSHSVVLYKNKMIVFGGFIGNKIGKYSNNIYQLNIQLLEWKIYDVKGRLPHPRANSAMCLTNSNKLYVFGGSDLSKKFNDMWKFDLQELIWEQIQTGQTQQEIPESRAGHTLVINNSLLILFGGIHDITHQKNDIVIFDSSINKWQTITQDLFQVSSNQSSVEQFCHKNEEQNEQYKNRQENIKKQVKKGVRLYKPLKESNYNNTQSLKNHPEKQQKSKQDIKKMQLLNEFDLTPQEKQHRNPSPTLEAMKSSISSIYSAQVKKKIQITNKSIIKTKKVGKIKPCARDGHTATFHDGRMVIIGGDRHMMSLNDVYILRLQGI